jgi:hypothetical protein
MEENNKIIGKTALKRQQRAAREQAIYNEYEAAVAAGSYKTDINARLMQKYEIKAISTLYAIFKRVQQRAKDQEGAAEEECV